MENWVLRGIIPAKMMYHVDDEALRMFSEISTEIVRRDINLFINNNINSENEEDRKLANRLKSTYASINAIDAYLESEEAKNLVNTLVSLDYRDINCDTSIELLEQWRVMILDLLSEDLEFMESYQTEQVKRDTVGLKPAYTKKYDKNNYDEVLNAMRDTAKKYPEGSLQYNAITQLCGVIKTYKKLFKNGNYKVNKPTIMRAATFKKDKLKIILRGLDFLLPRLKSGQSAYGWRVL